MLDYTPEELLDAYRQILLIRRFEERAGQLYGQGLIGGYCHLYIGQEAVVVGLEKLKQPQDTVITAYRDHGHMLACGMTAKGVMAELLGRKDGYSKGKGGSMHMFSREKNFFGGHGIVGASVSIGTGMALGHKLRKDRGVCMAYMGDGAVNQGQVYESFNMAALWQLPIAYIIEDNGYSMGTSTRRHAANFEYMSKRGEPMGIPGQTIDGMDLLEVYKGGKWLIDYVRSEQKPALLHIKTYRYKGHSMSDPGQYRTKEEVDTYKQADPLVNLKTLLTEAGYSDTDFKYIETKVRDEVLEAVAFARNSPEPEVGELYTDILVEAS